VYFAEIDAGSGPEVGNNLEWPYWGGKNSEPQSASKCATSTSHQNFIQIQYLKPSHTG